MKPKFLLIAAVTAFTIAVSCTNNVDVHYNVPDISMYEITEHKGGIFEFTGECSARIGIPGCDYFFLCSSSEKDFSKAERIAAKYSMTEKNCRYTALYEPSDEGTYYVRFCADNNGLSYVESQDVMKFEYVPYKYGSPVDLGLPSGVKWAQVNLGAETPEEYGNYYAWGETATKDSYSWNYYSYGRSGDELTKYCNRDGWGFDGLRDDITALELQDDAARANLKDKWRIPSDEEFAELMEYCKWTWTKSENGVVGYEVTSQKNGNSIFLPAAGWYSGNKLSEGMGCYWSNSLGKEPYRAGGIFFYEENCYLSDSDDFHFRYLGLPVRPVYGDYVSVESVMVYPESSTVELGGTVQLNATVSPQNATNRRLTWRSADTKVATVSESGLVTGVSAGTAYINAIASDGKTFAQCTVRVEPCVAVNLGLPSGLKWASCNVGATKPEEYGGYYAWGELKEKTTYDWSTYKWSQGTVDAMTKYCTKSQVGIVDNKTVLDLEDDVAHVNWGGEWRIPTDAEWTELEEYCTSEWTKQNGVYGTKLTSKKNGNSIFLPAAGYYRQDGKNSIGEQGRYFSASLNCQYPYLAEERYFHDPLKIDLPAITGYIHMFSYDGTSPCRCYGHSIRPVSGGQSDIKVTAVIVDPSSVSLDYGGTVQLNATVVPSNAKNKGMTWSSSNESIATVSADGLVTAVGPGEATVTVTSADGGYTATSNVTVNRYVDLGLSVKWAVCNVGASKPEEYGGYYQWGGTKDVSSTSIYLDWSSCPYHTGSSSSTGWTKYIPSNRSSYWSGTGSPDNKTVLDLEDDVAYMEWTRGISTRTTIIYIPTFYRMPTDAEWTELRENCTWTWTTQNGVNGYRVTSKKSGYTNKSIFLPAAGCRYGDGLDDAGSRGLYWSSSLRTDSPDFACNVGFILGEGYNGYCSRCIGLPVRPVSGDIVRVTGVSLNQTSLSLEAGGTYTLSATVAPSNAAERSVSWSSSNASVATVDADGKVTALKAGSATVTVTTTDGGYTATCSVTVTSSGPEAVDLGLSVKWATCNLGASKPEDYGDYYAWGETATKSDYSWSTYKWYKETSITKYCTDSSYGTVDNKTVLDSSDDAAHVNWGGSWRMPTDAEWTELRNNCTWTWTTQNGVKGYKVTSKKSGYTNKSIFLPAAGYRNGDDLKIAGSYGSYWSSSLSSGYPYDAYYVDFDSDYVERYFSFRYYGRSVRPVSGDIVRVTGVSLNQTSLSLEAGGTYTLSATVAPSNAAERSVSWKSSNTSVATVDESGKVTAVKAGNATITVSTTDGGYTATCSVTVTGTSAPEAVDLGLSVKWATCNLGASKPEEYGGYYQWAGTKDVSSTSIYLDYSNCPYHTGSSYNTGWTKYNTKSSYGTVDNKTVLDSSDDAAHVNWGGGWRMPTDAEWTELRNNCTWTWTTQNGVNGYRVTSKKSGYTNKSIFLPAADCRYGDGLDDAGSYGYYWSSSLRTDSPSSAWRLGFNSGNVGTYSYDRYKGLSVRPVSE